MRLLITGSNGFLGRRACPILRDYGFHVTAYSRSKCDWPHGIDSLISPSLSLLAENNSALSAFDFVLHLAGRAHVMNDTDEDPLSSYRQANVLQTLDLARKAAISGVRRFVYISSVKVNGDITLPFAPFLPTDVPNPIDPYAISKMEAEQGLLNISADTGMEVVIIRPPLIYGPNVKGNLKKLISLLARGVPLPFAAITFNRRSYISILNLIDFIAICLVHPRANGRVFLVSDQRDLSTAELLFKLGSAIGSPARLFPVDPSLLKFASVVFGRQSVYQRLCCSLCVDSSMATHLLGWSPPYSIEEGFLDIFAITHGY